MGLWSRKGLAQGWPGRHRHTGSEATERAQHGLEVPTHGSGTWSSLSYGPTASLPLSRAWEDKPTRGGNKSGQELLPGQVTALGTLLGAQQGPGLSLLAKI